MQKIDFQRFLFAFQGPMGTLSDTQSKGLEYLIVMLQQDIAMDDLRWCAYSLATAWWETGKTLMPIEEYGKGAGHEYGITDPDTGQKYYGRGYVQTTWKANYKTFSPLVKQDLVNHPELALIPATAYQIMSIGMRRGMFTGVSLGHYFNENVDDAVNARKIINGLDQAERIAGFHADILKALGDSLVIE